MPARVKDQLAMDETIVEDQELCSALEERQKAKDAISAIRVERLEPAQEAVAAAVEKIGVETGAALRCGRFRITRTEFPARSVSFETEAKTRLQIALIED